MATPDAARPLGVFDSGLGGLTVVRALRERLPGESIRYLGDTARVPYGSKSAETVARYSVRAARFLLEADVKLLLVACNTASAFALDALRAELAVPVLGAVEPGADEAVAATRSGRVGVIGTLGTVRSGSYPRAIAARDAAIAVAQLACPLLVPLVEEGWLGDGGEAAAGASSGKAGDDDEAAALERLVVETTARRYLGELHARAPDLDVLVLGCTHYPLLEPLLARVAQELWRHEVRLVDSAHAMARAAAQLLGAALHPGHAGALRCYLTDEARFAEVGARFLGTPLEHVERVDL